MGPSLPGSLLLLGLFTAGTGVSGEDPGPVMVTGTLGGSVTLPLQLQPGQPVESISWLSRSVSTAIATVTLAEAGGPDTLYQAETRYRGRVSVVGPGRSLHISNLSWTDAGPYRAHINLRGSRLTRTREYRLQVYEPLAQPRVTLSSRIGENGHCIFILTCVVESRGGSVTYSWLPLGPRAIVSHGGSVLSVSSRPGDRALTFTCVIKNPVSNSSSLPVSVPSSCPGPGILGGDTVGETVTGLLGDLAILPLEVPVGQEVEKVTWSSGGRVAVMQPGPGGQPVLAAGTQGAYSRRWSTVHRGYSLQIRPLRLQDSGLYRAWLALQSPRINITRDFTLRVYEKLREPNITVSSQITKDGACHITLICSLQQSGEDIQYRWAPLGQGAVMSHGGTTLRVSWTPGVSDSYRCTVSNPVSQSSSSVLPGPLCSGPSSCLSSPWNETKAHFLLGISSTQHGIGTKNVTLTVLQGAACAGCNGAQGNMPPSYPAP
ncbi:T-lymphocyte surface antigen Ly-9-like isoform X4 [Ursus maritimus]|uniref:T-lymphocyte surface antigen Ly-9-like isoform X4 n=1 Tax=Ursus maritimus TaxID=29073 RepID=A0A8M1G888_URSMA|nr:T-lymphocyte surface antigen Ly-9-like isoform X4 [Ursus maritimus]